MSRLIAADSLKQRRTWVFPLTLLGPVGVIGLIVIEWLLRGEWLHEAAAADGAWVTLLRELVLIDIAAMVLGVALLSSMVFDVDHRSQGWKQVFALPISKISVYMAKFGTVAGLILVSSILVGAGTSAVWIWLGFGSVPWTDIGLLVILPWFAVLPIIAWQVAVSANVRNQAVALTVGVVGTVVTLFGSELPDWLPWATLADAAAYTTTAGIDISRVLLVSAGWTCFLLLGGTIAFDRGEVG